MAGGPMGGGGGEGGGGSSFMGGSGSMASGWTQAADTTNKNIFEGLTFDEMTAPQFRAGMRLSAAQSEGLELDNKAKKRKMERQDQIRKALMGF